MSTVQSPVQALEQYLGCEWSAIRKARETAAANGRPCTKFFGGNSSAIPASYYLARSRAKTRIAREEMTSGSDADWILLADGRAFPEHEIQKGKVARLLEENKFGEPGSSGVFGCLVGSHSLVHEIGGEDDTNSNTTRRLLLLLESFAVGDHEPYARVRRQVLNRYLQDDRGLLSCNGKYRVPKDRASEHDHYLYGHPKRNE